MGREDQQPTGPAGAPGAAVPRRSVLKGMVVAAAGSGAVAGGAGTAHAAADVPTAATAGRPPARSATATSPGGRAEVAVSSVDGRLSWSARYDGRTVLEPAPLGLVLASGAVLGTDARVTGVGRRAAADSWRPVCGRRARITAAYREVRVDATDPATGIAFSVVARAYDEGVAVRYLLNSAPTPGGVVTLAGETTTFALPAGSIVYASRDESPYTRLTPGQLDISGGSGTDAGALADQPLTAVTPSGALACLCESNRTHFPRLMLNAVAGAPNTLVSHLMQHAGRGNTAAETTFGVTAPFATPWRAVVLGSSAAELADHADLVPTLADPTAIDDTSWIVPGKAIRETTLTTAGGLACVDFAVAHGLRYVEFDAGWYGPENSASSDPTVPIAALDLAQVISYGASKGVGVLVYVNQIALTDAASLFATYQQWGLAGMKLGFILDGTQAETDWILDTVAQAASRRLLLNLHDDLRPFGQDRTYPNWINMEGVRGNEHFPTAAHNVTLPFVRNIGGPMDYTICYAQSRDRTTNAHQLAMAAVYYAPLAWLYWYDVPSKYATGSWPELAWFDAIPTTWDESRALAGAIGEYAVVARRGGETWYLGAMTGEQTRTLDVPLDFLGPGSWQATIYADGSPANPADVPASVPVTISTQDVDATTVLRMRLAEAGGQAILLRRT